MKKIIFVISVILLLAFLVLLPNFIKINSIDCKSQYGPCSDSIAALFSDLKGKSYLKVSGEINKRLKNTHDIASFNVRFSLPDKFTVNVIEKKPIISLTSDNQNFFLVDKQGFIVDEVSESNLPKVIIDPGLNITMTKGQKLSDDISFSLLVMQKMYYAYNINVGHLTSDSISVDLNGKKIIFPLKGDIDVLMGSLTVILSRLNSEGNYSIIDLRYKNPVLK